MKLRIGILYNYLFEFQIIQAGDCEKPNWITSWATQFLFGQISSISGFSQSHIQILSNSGKQLKRIPIMKLILLISFKIERILFYLTMLHGTLSSLLIFYFYFYLFFNFLTITYLKINIIINNSLVYSMTLKIIKSLIHNNLVITVSSTVTTVCLHVSKITAK